MSSAAAAAGGGAEERQGEAPLPCVLGLPVALPLRDAVSRMDAGVPRKARTGRQLPRPQPATWWAFRLPVPPPVKAKKTPAKARPPAAPAGEAGPVLGLMVPSSPPDLGAAAAAAGGGGPPDVEKPAKKARICVQCGAAETPQWRSGPMGRSTLCNACGVRLRAAGALRETQLTPPAAAKKAVEKPPPPPAPAALAPESPASDSSSDSPILQRLAPLEDVYLVRKPSTRERRPPRKDSPPPPSPPASPAVYLVKKKKPSKKKCRPRNTGQMCQHCGTTSTPQWREGPTGRHTLCNACGVRWRQGRLLPEYRPAASPTFDATEHACRHRDVLQLHQQQQTRWQPPSRVQLQPAVDEDVKPESDGDDKSNVFLVRRQQPAVKEYPPTPLHRPLLQPVNGDDDPRVGGNKDSAAGAGRGGGGDDATTGAMDLLLVPSAPLIVDGDFLLR